MKFCGCIDINCDQCFEMIVSYCPSNPINLNVGQSPGSQIYLWIIDKLNNTFFDLVTVKSDGSVDVNLNNFPKGMFTPDFGALDIFLSSDSAGKNILPMGTLYPSETFNCIMLSVDEPVFITDDSECYFLKDDNGNFLIAG